MSAKAPKRITEQEFNSLVRDINASSVKEVANKYGMSVQMLRKFKAEKTWAEHLRRLEDRRKKDAARKAATTVKVKAATGPIQSVQRKPLQKEPRLVPLPTPQQQFDTSLLQASEAFKEHTAKMTQHTKLMNAHNENLIENSDLLERDHQERKTASEKHTYELDQAETRGVMKARGERRYFWELWK